MVVGLNEALDPVQAVADVKPLLLRRSRTQNLVTSSCNWMIGLCDVLHVCRPPDWADAMKVDGNQPFYYVLPDETDCERIFQSVRTSKYVAQVRGHTMLSHYRSMLHGCKSVQASCTAEESSYAVYRESMTHLAVCLQRSVAVLHEQSPMLQSL